MKILFEEYGRMVLSVICGMIVIVLLAFLMTKLGEVNNDHLSNAIGAETTIIKRTTSEITTEQPTETTIEQTTLANGDPGDLPWG